MNISDIRSERIWNSLFAFKGMFIPDDGVERCAAQIIMDFTDIDRNEFVVFCNNLFRNQDATIQVGPSFLIQKEHELVTFTACTSIVYFNLADDTETFYQSISYIYYCLYGSYDGIRIRDD